ncbi:ABC transporter ATP-binding protein [Rubellimicrobium roseum]|uniref:ABC transporter ATP-binding protein n=1 Tax=Rubellimicrobium roseum TaxID=687525 RepID=A0A5C4NGX2_9RHOB|nr:ABC transporter ATP-binding protein [Rubellimicrobium roseum]TNC73853.1 ABC transporter ATP-binding protein [Rubellimicrobium roseum]
MPEGTPNVLEVRNLRTVFRTRAGSFHAVNDVSFTLKAGEILGVVGESGSGKSVLAMSLLGLLPSPPAEVSGGPVLFEGQDLLRLDPEALRSMRGGRIGFVVQDRMTALNPVLTLGFQIVEPLRLHLGLTRRQARARAAELMAQVGIPDAHRRLDDYPHQVSGDLRQRVLFAIALACDPTVLIADEPTAALDVTIQAEIHDLMQELRQTLGIAVLWITQDPGVVAGLADRVIVMHGGQVVEHAPVDALFADPRHPYTQALLASVPKARVERVRRLAVMEGQPPVLRTPPDVCTFRDRCPHAYDVCHRLNPQRYPVGEGHDAACFLSDPGLAPQRPQLEVVDG